ncbi:CBS domain-containing protein, partial [Streptococcus pyogenes]
SLMDVLKVIHQKHFSQFPVFDNKGYVGIISNSGIANWLAALSQKGTFSSEDLHRIKIAEVIPFEENGDAVISLFKETTLHQTLH